MQNKALRSRRIGQVIIIVAGFIAIASLLLIEQQTTTAPGDLSLAVFSLPAGAYDEDVQLSIDSPNPEAPIYFTLDGRNPTPMFGILYNDPIPLSAAEPNVVVLKASALLPEGEMGPVTSATYFMGLDNSLPLMSIIVEPEDFWGDERGIYTNHIQRGREWERPINLTYVDGERPSDFHIGAGVRLHGGLTRAFADKKSLRLYFRGEYGERKLAYPLFGAEGQIAFDTLVLHNSGQDLLLFKNQLVDRLTENIGGYAARSQPVLLFINGRPWGIYYLRERIDERLLAENYGLPAADISDTPNNRGMQSEEELAVDTVHWENVMVFVLENDMSDPANYAYLQTQIDLENFVDYYLLQMYIANTDWPHHNVHQFRPRTQGGRWEWIVWDNDFAFDLVDRQMVDHVLNVQHPLGEGITIFLNKLLANPEFYHLFLTRTADLLNTILAPPNVLAEIDQITANLSPDILYERERWSIPVEWDTAVTHMRQFAEQRPDTMRQHMIESLGLSGLAQITILAAEPGWVVVNDTKPQPLPWQGIHFQDTTITLQAVPETGYAFAGWDGLPENVTNVARISLSITADLTLTPRFNPLPVDIPQPRDAIITGVHHDDEDEIDGDWFELMIRRPGGVDLSGWRVTDNDSLVAADEGSLIFKKDPLLADLPTGTIVRVIATESKGNDGRFPHDGWLDGVLTLYVGNGRINTTTDPWFNLGAEDNLALLAPGPSNNPMDDIPIDLWAGSSIITPATFGLPPVKVP